ncbi:hypothetical protein BKA70DRAFT_1334831 [Coprinopsis sp. MPI-PUGE-AT-0042]|nr:hypothetical protein BKA70DRAFT_1334831 [Coprinopsis sp. MPI-PUGE-AT-0042]
MSDHISVFPPEILLHIFKPALPGPLLREGRLHFQVIRSVCSEWRLLSFSSFKNSYGATDFPYEMFGTLDIGRLDVRVRW